MAVYCGASVLSSCINENMDPNLPPDPTGGTAGSTNQLIFDLADPTNSKLNSVGGYVIKNNIVVARISDTAFAAVTLICSHDNKKEITYRNGEFYCTAHGARFNNEGVGLNSKGSKGLKTYQTVFSGTTLRVLL